MGPGNWRTGLDIERLLTEKPEQFDFFQAVKIIEQLRRRLGVAESEETSTHQQVKFSSVVSQAFPTTNVTEIYLSEGANEPAEMRILKVRSKTPTQTISPISTPNTSGQDKDNFDFMF